MRGKFVVFEGIDGCGKGTQLRLAASYLFGGNKDLDLYLTREPTRHYREIRERMKQSSDATQDAEWYARMFVEDRRTHIVRDINPALEKGIHVLCDRYKYSTLSYQSAQGMCIRDLIMVHKDLLVPDLTIIFDVPAEIAFERRRRGGATDVFERDLEFQKNVRGNYLALPGLLQNEDIRIIDGNKSIEYVFEEVKRAIDGILCRLMQMKQD